MAGKIFQKVLKNYPKTWWAQLSWLDLSKVKLKTGAKGEGIKLLENFIKKNSESPLIEKAKFNLCVAYIVNKNYQSAKKNLKDFISSYPDSKRTSDAKKLLKDYRNK